MDDKTMEPNRFWAEENGVRLRVQFMGDYGPTQFTIEHPEGDRSGTIANYRLAKLCDYLDTNIAKQLRKKESLLERIRLKAMETDWMDHLTEALGDELAN